MTHNEQKYLFSFGNKGFDISPYGNILAAGT